MSAYTNQPILVAGLGATGLSLVRYLSSQGARVTVTDTRAAPPGLAQLQKEFPQIPLRLGRNDPGLLEGIEHLALSPGVDLRLPFIIEAQQRGLPLWGDIEFFARAIKARPQAQVVGITGSNGKSTVTTLLGEMARVAGKSVAVGGNLGTPALDLLREDAEIYLFELSSFQLELTQTFACTAAVCLNVSADHIDRHGSLEHYRALKLAIYRNARVAVTNADDSLAQPQLRVDQSNKAFGLGTPAGDAYGLIEEAGARWLAQDHEKILPLAALRIYGLHNAANALAALALGDALGLSRAAMVKALRDFGGLPHRCQWVAEVAHVNYYNDSKGTNVGATLAAMAGLPVPVVLLAGGQAKGGDFKPWRPLLKEKGRALVLFGEDAPLIARAVGDAVAQYQVGSMREAVQQAAAVARPGDAVLLSPGCASFDMFQGYADRGAQFSAEVARLGAAPQRQGVRA
ncbi:MAG: UDP-N-acetylmuramoyl-L-alanine--D-glutamate ligase [Nevskiales bacterium]